MKHSQFVAAATALMRARKPFIVFGPPGGGKTAGLVQAAEQAGMKCVITHPVIQEEVDWRGLPGFVQQGGETRAVFLPFGFLRELTESGPATVCIVDDVGQARMSVQASLMQAVHLREVDGVPIRENVTWALASNRREDKAAVTGMVSALLDRMVVAVNLDFDANELGSHLLAKGYEPLLAAFIRFNPRSVHFEVKDEFVKNSTPRSIEGFAQLLQIPGLNSIEVLSGACGPSFATEYLSYAKVERKLPTLEQIVKDPEGTAVPEEKDVLFALMASLAGRLDKKTLAPGIEYISRCPPEFAVMAMKDLVKRVPEIGQEQAFKTWSRKNLKLLGM
ncbi:MAG: hypothetical protein L0Z53_06615 [Acidobacteriales bacterium]|nr:hypothetical protein [Terriglobales bacterium]